MPWQEFSALFLVCTAMSFSPGPNTALSTALAANHGLRRTLPFCLAVPVGWTLLMLACGLGLGALITRLPALRWGLQLAGSAYLLGLAARFLASPNPAAPTAAQGPLVGFLQGVLLQFVNIKAWLLALTLTAGWVTPASAAPNGLALRLAIVCLTLVGFAFSSNFVYALAGALLRRWLEQGARLRWFNRAMASVLATTGIWMAAPLLGERLDAVNVLTGQHISTGGHP